MPRHQFISNCDKCGTEGVAGSHQPGQTFACFECQATAEMAAADSERRDLAVIRQALERRA